MVRFGVFVPQGWRLDLPPNLSPREQWDIIKRVALRAEELGFHSLWVYDHFHTVPKPLSGRSVFEAWTTLSALSSITEKIRLGTLVTCILYRQPSYLAKVIATIDAISGGRVEAGVGACWYEHEFLGYGYPFPKPAERIKRLEEAIQIMKLMWTQPEVNFEGKYYKLKGALCDPKPVQKPHPPILVGGGGEKLTLRVAAKHADKWNIGGSLEVFKRKLEVLKKHCKKVGRDFNSIVKVHSGITMIGNDEELKKKIKELNYFKLRGISLEELKKMPYVGTPEKIIESINEAIRIGVSEIYFYLPEAYKIKPLEELVEKVLSEIK